MRNPYRFRTYRQMDDKKAEEIRRRYFAREATQKELGREYGITQQAVSKIVCEDNWYRPVSKWKYG